MEDKHFIILGIYLVPFAIAVLMPGWRALGAFALALAVFALWFFVIKDNESGGIALSIEKALYWLGMIGALAGAISRAVALGFVHAGWPGWTAFAVYALGAVLPVVLFFVTA